jgi:hypothetical protein
MEQVVQARLDAATARTLARLRRRTGLTDSELVRKGLLLLLLSAEKPRSGRLRIRGLGRFASGRSDLGSNKRRLVGLGK